METQKSSVEIIDNYLSENNSKFYIQKLTDGECLITTNEYDKEYELDAVLREINMFALPDHMIVAKIGFNHCLADDSGHIPQDMSVLKVKIIDFEEEENPVYLKRTTKDSDLEVVEIYKIDHFEPQESCMKVKHRSDAPEYKNGMGMIFESANMAISTLREETPILSGKREFERYVFGNGNLFSDYMKVERRFVKRKARTFKTIA